MLGPCLRRTSALTGLEPSGRHIQARVASAVRYASNGAVGCAHRFIVLRVFYVSASAAFIATSSVSKAVVRIASRRVVYEDALGGVRVVSYSRQLRSGEAGCR